MASVNIGSGTNNNPSPAYGGSAPTPQAANAEAAALAAFLHYAPTKPLSIYGSVSAADGAAGGSIANISWQRDIPIVPAFCIGIEYQIQIACTLTLAATTGAATLSPFAPYSAIMNQITLGGAPPWPLTELLPWYLDDILHHVNFDPAYAGLGGAGSRTDWPASGVDYGPFTVELLNTTASSSVTPGQTFTNTTGAATTTNFLLNFRVRQNLQRKRHLLYGCIPLGDPQNRPVNLMQVSPLVGVNPEQTLFTNVSSGSSAVLYNDTTNGVNGVQVTATYLMDYIDILPKGVQVAQPSVNFGLQLTPFSINSNITAGNVFPITHRTAQLYTSIHHLVINNQTPTRPDYYGLWDDQDQQSARWSYDGQANTFNQFYADVHRTYRRYLPTGHFPLDMENGLFPEISSVTPYEAKMTPDEHYAQLFGVPPTPAMSTAFRYPSTDTLANPYVRVYSFGLVEVPF